MPPYHLFYSCDLERNPLTEFSEDKFWTSEENAELAIVGLYRSNITNNNPEYSPSDWWGYGTSILLDGVTDIAFDRRNFNNNLGKLTSGAILPNNSYVRILYTNSYKKIAGCNRFIENIDKLGESNKINRLKSEARFLRATQYFYLASYYGSVPLVTKVLTLNESNNVEKASKEEIITFVCDEMSAISALLPRTSELSTNEIGRATRQAALAFLGRMKMVQKDFKGAAEALIQIIDLGDNEISPDYKTLFYQANENSTENIFSMQYIDDLAGNGLPQHAFPLKDGGWCIINPTANLFESYEFKDGTPFSYDDPRFNSNNLGDNRDPRLDYTLYYDRAIFRGTTYTCHPESKGLDKIGAGQVTQTGYMMRKFFDENWSGSLTSYGGNIPIIRYADVLLMYLEALVEDGATITQATLDMTINKVRGRASVNMPPITETNNDALRTIVRHERKIELALEGHRLWDLIRWGIAEEKLNEPIYGAPFIVNNQDCDKEKRWTNRPTQ